MAKSLRNKDREISDNNGSAYGPISKENAEIANLEPGEECVEHLVLTKHGVAILFHSKHDQPKIEDIGEEL